MSTRLLNSNINRLIAEGVTDTVPMPAIALTGAASWSDTNPTSLRITGYNVSQLLSIKPFDAILVGEEMAIVAESPKITGATVIVIKLIGTKTFTTTFVAQAAKHGFGPLQRNYPVDWHIDGNDYILNGVTYNLSQNFSGQSVLQGVAKIVATAVVRIGTGFVSGGAGVSGGEGGDGGSGLATLEMLSTAQGTVYCVVDSEGTKIWYNYAAEVIAEPEDLADKNLG